MLQVHLLKLKIIRLKITKLLKRKNAMNDIEYLGLIYTDSVNAVRWNISIGYDVFRISSN